MLSNRPGDALHFTSGRISENAVRPSIGESLSKLAGPSYPARYGRVAYPSLA